MVNSSGRNQETRPKEVLQRSGENFSIGVAYFGLAAWVLSWLTGQAYWLTALQVAAAASVLFIAALTLAVGWAMRPEGAPWLQFRLRSLFVIMIIAAVVLAGMRGVLLALGDDITEMSGQGMLAGLMWVVGFLAISAPFVLCFGDGLLWAAVWLVRNATVRRLFRVLLRVRNDK